MAYIIEGWKTENGKKKSLILGARPTVKDAKEACKEIMSYGGYASVKYFKHEVIKKGNKLWN